ncbi:hypothetical protein F66182_738 [Fusarium sp. NRRL 66182]|nr:hypothetical protein F66182_738 [Fusarium sp. NRRL 66182]
MAPPQLGATFVPGGFDDYYMPEVVAPSPQRVTPQVPQNMQEDLQRMELEATSVEPRSRNEQGPRHTREPSLSTYTNPRGADPPRPQATAAQDSNDEIRAYQSTDKVTQSLSAMNFDAPSFSPFPKVKGDNVPPTDEDKEEILWNARKHVLHSQNVSMQITWARDVLTWADISQESSIREYGEKNRPATPRIEHELRVDAINIITYLSQQEHPEALYMRSKWLEFGKFGNRVDKREAYIGYKRAAELGHGRSEYRMGMLYEQSNDMSKAKEHYYRGLSLKDSASLYRMGMMSLLGQHGETKDYSTGLERIQAAADSSDEDAPQGAYVYGMLIGRDLPDITIPEGLLPNNPMTTKMYIEKSAYLGFAKAQLKMGQAYELCQFSCDFNPSYSLHYYGLAAKQGLPEAALGVSRWFLFGYEGVFKKNEALAYKYAQEAAAAKLPTGEFALGYYNEIGIHVEKSLAEARKWYQIAADHGNQDAIGRLESLDEDKTLSKSDHETTTLTRIKSQHGSQRGKRPDRFKQPAQQMPTLSEGSAPGSPSLDGPGYPKPQSDSPGMSPNPSLGIRPTIVSEHVNFPDPSRASFVLPATSADRAPAFNVRLDENQAPPRSQSAAPYPEDDRPPPLTVRSKSTAPYPEDDTQGPTSPRPNQGMGPPADRPSSAFGIKPQSGGRPMPASQSMGNLHPGGPGGAGRPDPRNRAASTGWEGAQQAPAGRPSPYPDDGQRPGSSGQYSAGGGSGGRLQKPPTSGQYSPGLQGPQSQNYERFSRVPGASGRPERLSSLPQNQQQQQPPHPSDARPPRTSSAQPQAAMVAGGAGPGGRPSPGPFGGPQGGPQGGSTGPPRTGSAPPSQFQRPENRPSPAPSAATAPLSKGGKGPATFEDMGIPQGKQDSDCEAMNKADEEVGREQRFDNLHVVNHQHNPNTNIRLLTSPTIIDMSHFDHGIQLQSLGPATAAEGWELPLEQSQPDLERAGSNSPNNQSDRGTEFGQSILERVVSQASSGENPNQHHNHNHNHTPPPDGGWAAWLVVLSSHLVYMNTWGWVNSFGIFQAHYTYTLSLPVSKISWIGSVSVFLLFFVGTLTGRLVDAGHFRWVFLAGIVLQVAGLMMTSVCTNYWQLFTAQGIVIGLGHGCVFCPVLAVLSTYFARRRALAMGVAATGSATGGMLFPSLVRQLLPRVGFGWTLRITGLVQLVALIVALVLTKPRIKPRASGPLVEFAAFKDTEYTLYVVASFFTCMGNYLAYYFIAVYSRTALDPPFSFTESLDLLMILNGVGIVGRVLANWLVDYVGAINVFAPHAMVASVLLYSWMAVSAKPGLYTWSVLYGIFAAAIQSLFPTGVSVLTEDLSKIGVRMGMAFTIASFATLTGPPIAGAIIDREGGYKGAQAFAGTILALGAAFLVAAKKKRMRRTGAGWMAKI